MRMHPTTPVRLAVVVAMLHTGVWLYLISLAFLLVFLGVMLPAAWSTKPARRRAAATVLAQILTALRGGSPRTCESGSHDRHVVGGECAITCDDREPPTSGLRHE